MKGYGTEFEEGEAYEDVGGSGKRVNEKGGEKA